LRGLYEILDRQRDDGWGTRVIENLARDLRSAFPGMHGLSLRNLGYMKAFAEAWSDEQILQQVVAKLPWGHNVRLLDLVKGPEERLWYARRTLRIMTCNAVCPLHYCCSIDTLDLTTRKSRCPFFRDYVNEARNAFMKSGRSNC